MGENRSVNEQLMQENIGVGTLLEEMLEGIENIPRSISTGIPSLDKALGGGIRGVGITTLMARPSFGKTSLAAQIALHVSNGGQQVIYFTNDVGKEEMLIKNLSQLSYALYKENGFSMQELYDLIISRKYKLDSNFQQLQEEFKKQSINLRYIDTVSMLSIEEIKEDENVEEDKKQSIDLRYIDTVSMLSIEEIKEDENVEKDNKIIYSGNDLEYLNDIIRCYDKEIKPLLIIDYLQTLNLEKDFETKKNIDEAVKRIKIIALAYKIPILLISSINRLSYDRSLTLDSLKEAGSIEYHSDIVCGLQFVGIGKDGFNLEKEKSNEWWNMEVTILKNKMGKADIRVPIKFYPRCNLFIEQNTKEKENDNTMPITEKMKKKKK